MATTTENLINLSNDLKAESDKYLGGADNFEDAKAKAIQIRENVNELMGTLREERKARQAEEYKQKNKYSA